MREKSLEMMKQIKNYIENFTIDSAGKKPTTREIGAAMGLSHVSVIRYLRMMDEAGLAVYRDGRIETDRLERMHGAPSFSRNYPEGISAGPGEDLEGIVDEYFPIAPFFLGGRKGEFFTLSVHGDSMVTAGIFTGDIVICQKAEEARPGQIVAAWIEGEGNTLKRLCLDEKGLYLRAENDSWPEEKRFFGRRFRIQGIAFKVVREL